MICIFGFNWKHIEHFITKTEFFLICKKRACSIREPVKREPVTKNLKKNIMCLYHAQFELFKQQNKNLNSLIIWPKVRQNRIVPIIFNLKVLIDKSISNVRQISCACVCPTNHFGYEHCLSLYIVGS